ncbi:hypothetical protein QN415_12075, partial [Pseudomonas sp. 5S4]|uniref:hypothetical protein n=1 Tax=Pseudomonas sp. 5S4 TaxID=3048596 RepID=UPI002B222A0D
IKQTLVVSLNNVITEMKGHVCKSITGSYNKVDLPAKACPQAVRRHSTVGGSRRSFALFIRRLFP